MPYNFRPLALPNTVKATPERIADRKVGIAFVPVGNAPSAKRDVKLYRAWADQNEWIRCFSSDTEILTPRGWVLFPELEDRDKVLTYNQESDRLEFQRPISRNASPYNGEFHYIRSRQVDVAVTPNHRMLYQPSRVRVGVGSGGDGLAPLIGWQMRRVDSLPETTTLRFRVAGRWEGVGASHFVLPEVSYGNGRAGERGSGEGHHGAALPPLPMQEWLQFIGYFVSEGCTSTGNDGHYYTCLTQKNPVILEKMGSVCEILFGKRPNAVEKKGWGGYDLTIYGKQLWSWLKEHAGVLAAHKRLPRFVFDLPSSYLEVLLTALMEGDGSWHPVVSRSSGTYYTASKGLADDVQELCIRLGWRSIINDRQRPDRQREYLVSITRARDTATVIPAVHREIVSYVGMVYCVTVPNDTVVTRRNGRVSMHGNSAINHRKFQVSSAPWDIVPIDAAIGYDPAIQLRMVDLISHPNPATDSFRTFIEKCVEDILVLDAGVVEVVRTYRGIPSQLWNVDGANIRVSQTWLGDPADPRYFWYPNGRFGAALFDQDLIYMMQNPSTHRVLGLSPLETLRETIDAEMQAARYNKGQVMQAPPQGIIDIGEDATVENVEQFARYWNAEIAGLKTTSIIGGTKNAKFLNFGRSQRDMQFLQWQSYLIRKIAAVFSISPQDLGILFDVNRANAETQADISEDRGLRPLISLIESYINREVIGTFQRQRAKQMYWAGEMDSETMAKAIMLSYLDARTEARLKLFKQMPDANLTNLRFRFKIPSGRSTAARAATHKLELGGIPWTTINKVRDEELEDPVEGGNEIIVMTPMGPIRLSSIAGTTPPNVVEQAFIQYALKEPKIVSTNGNSVEALTGGETVDG